jgi:hypothetical protein
MNNKYIQDKMKKRIQLDERKATRLLVDLVELVQSARSMGLRVGINVNKEGLSVEVQPQE